MDQCEAAWAEFYAPSGEYLFYYILVQSCPFIGMDEIMILNNSMFMSSFLNTDCKCPLDL